jgi:hypothetical protein
VCHELQIDDSDPSIDRSFGYENTDSAEICAFTEVRPDKTSSERAFLMHLEDDGHVVVKPTPRGDEKTADSPCEASQDGPCWRRRSQWLPSVQEIVQPNSGVSAPNKILQ